jgi:hypothetical protein
MQVTMKVNIERNAFPPEFGRFFPPHTTDFGYQAMVQSAIEAEWYGITITDGARAFAHLVAPKAIPGTAWCDVEPFILYTGFLTTSAEPGFLAAALAAYSEACRSLRIIAELVRFNPIPQNHVPFLGRGELDVVAAKSVVVVACETEEERQLGHFSFSGRKIVRRSLRELRGRLLDKSREMDLFRHLYERGLDRLGAAPHWRFGDRFYAAIAACPDFAIESVWSGDRLAGAQLVGMHPTAWHYLLLATADDYPRGTCERLTYQTARQAAAAGCQQAILGGGVTAAPDDGVLLFKARFARELTPFFIGKMVHDKAAFCRVTAAAVAARPALADSGHFLKHRLAQA